MPTREWDLVKRVQEGKMSINLQMKMWAESMWDKNLECCLLFPDELREYCKDYPKWVFRGTLEQGKKRILELNDGYVPSFIRNA